MEEDFLQWALSSDDEFMLGAAVPETDAPSPPDTAPVNPLEDSSDDELYTRGNASPQAPRASNVRRAVPCVCG